MRLVGPRVAEHRHERPHAAQNDDLSGPSTQSPVHSLSDRELEVFEQIGRGRSTKDIARQLHLSIRTVETHREKIKAKLDLKSASELNRAAVQWILEQGG